MDYGIGGQWQNQMSNWLQGQLVQNAQNLGGSLPDYNSYQNNYYGAQSPSSSQSSSSPSSPSSSSSSSSSAPSSSGSASGMGFGSSLFSPQTPQAPQAPAQATQAPTPRTQQISGQTYTQQADGSWKLTPQQGATGSQTNAAPSPSQPKPATPSQPTMASQPTSAIGWNGMPVSAWDQTHLQQAQAAQNNPASQSIANQYALNSINKTSNLWGEMTALNPGLAGKGGSPANAPVPTPSASPPKAATKPASSGMSIYNQPAFGGGTGLGTGSNYGGFHGKGGTTQGGFGGPSNMNSGFAGGFSGIDNAPPPGVSSTSWGPTFGAGNAGGYASWGGIG